MLAGRQVLKTGATTPTHNHRAEAAGDDDAAVSARGRGAHTSPPPAERHPPTHRLPARVRYPNADTVTGEGFPVLPLSRTCSTGRLSATVVRHVVAMEQPGARTDEPVRTCSSSTIWNIEQRPATPRP